MTLKRESDSIPQDVAERYKEFEVHILELSGPNTDGGAGESSVLLLRRDAGGSGGAHETVLAYVPTTLPADSILDRLQHDGMGNAAIERVLKREEPILLRLRNW